ncbi:hypothetical protein PO124_18255 [Bacillus licheniformis]|nr:hypothetical protein [Bacillus licheniformis]
MSWLTANRRAGLFRLILHGNTRAAYPIDAIDNIVKPSIAAHPQTIVF